MADIARPSGITVSISGPAELGDEAPAKRSAKNANRAAAGGPADGNLLLKVLAEQDLELVDSVPLTIPMAARPAKRGVPAPCSTVTLDVPLGPDEHAVALVEDEGEYRWIVDGKQLPAAAPKRGGQLTGKRRIRFSVELKAAPPARTTGAKRGWVDELVGEAAVYVFRFVVTVAAKPTIGFFERNVKEGLVAISAPDPQEWRLLGDDEALPVKLPMDRPARVLLFMHGTFSSTVGSFAALGLAPKARGFLDRALQNYDVVLGFDHLTLSVDPHKNAADLMARLRRGDWPQPPHIDMIAYSRGGLVARSLVERLLPKSGWSPTIGRVAFVGCTNGGTLLAEPENWRRFADQYTNLALGVTRAIGFVVPGMQGATMIAGQAIRGVGALVKGLAYGVVADKAAPGIAAMEPAGTFVAAINEAQPGQLSPADTHYFAVTSSFEAAEALNSDAAPELPPKFLMRVADSAAEELYRETNDLVVNVRSMTLIVPALGDFVKGKLAYGTDAGVYHLNYFTHAETAAKFIEWFGLPTTTPVPLKRGVARGGIKTTPSETEKLTIKKTATRKAAAKKSGKHAAASRAPGHVERSIADDEEALPIGEKRGTYIGGVVEGFSMTPEHATRGSSPKRSMRNSDAEKAKLNPWPPKGHQSPEDALEADKQKGGDSRQVECHFRAEMDKEVVVDRHVSVDVTIARHALEVAVGRSSSTASASVEVDTKLIVQIAERRNFRIDGERRVEIDMPEPDGEANISFDVTGLVADEEGELWVQVRQGPIPLATMKLKPQIVAAASATPAPRLPVRVDLTALPPPEPPLDALLIEESFVGDDVQYRYFLDLPSLNIRKRFESKVIRGRDAYVTKIMNGIGDAWAGSRPDQLSAFETDLKAIGATMFDELLPREMQELLWEQRDRIVSVQVFSMEPFIPWELVYLRDPSKQVISDASKFLGELGLVRWLYDGYPPVLLSLGAGRARYIIPTYSGHMALPHTAEEERMLKQLFDAKKVEARAGEVQKLLRTPGTFDLLHFGGHAEAADEKEAGARLLLDQTNDGSTENALRANTVMQIAQLDDGGHRPIVVLNACESARMNRSFAGMGGFASAFVTRGAGVFVGTHWSVGDSPASTFIEAFYEYFLKPKPGHKALSLREAVQKARQAARHGGDATWLAYVVYGHPRATVSSCAASRRGRKRVRSRAALGQ